MIINPHEDQKAPVKKLKTGDRVLIVITALTLLFSLFVISPFSKRFISMAVMSVYSAHCAKDGIPQKENITVGIPGGKTPYGGWYPFVLTFVPGEHFGRTLGRDLDLTILYNFADFDPLRGCSRLYMPGSGYYSSFYGAYLVKSPDAYGFVTDENNAVIAVNEQEAAYVALYDYQNLVLSDFGLTPQNAVFDFTVTDTRFDVSYSGSDGWIAIDAELTVNGCLHEKTQFVPSYLQYGIPPSSGATALSPVKMFGRMYGKYLPEKQVSVFFYVIAESMEVLEACDRDLLSKSKLQYEKAVSL